MNLETQIASARKRVHRDGYDMSFGELASMYERDELVINPEYQRLFRWTEDKKTAFIESLLLNIPIPPIFVFTRSTGFWELVDGLQRVSTVFELMGILKDADGNPRPRFICSESDLLPDLQGRFWPKPGETSQKKALNQSQQIAIRRSRIRIEILDQQTDPEVKFELFQRLNTGGTNLSEQEVRNCVIASLNNSVYSTLLEMSKHPSFVKLAGVGQEREKRQYSLELIVRLIVIRNVKYTRDVDIHKYLDRGIVSLLTDPKFDWEAERKTFERTMDILLEAVGADAFRTNKRFSLGKYEFASVGVSKLLEKKKAPDLAAIKTAVGKVSALPEAKKYSGGGVKGGTRLSKFIIPLAQSHFDQP